MYNKGLIHTVDIYSLERNTSNRLTKTQMKASEATIENVPCRIVKDERVMFAPEITLKVGDVIRDTSKNREYTVVEEYIASGFKVHHRTYKVEKKVI